MDNKNLIIMRDTFRGLADVIDELLDLSDREEKGEDVKKEVENVTGRLVLKLMELESLK